MTICASSVQGYTRLRDLPEGLCQSEASLMVHLRDERGQTESQLLNKNVVM